MAEEGPEFDLFQTVIDEKSDTNWCVIIVDKKKLSADESVGAGNGVGLSTLVEKLKSLEGSVAFACIKINGVDERETVTSTRPKYIQVNYVGPKVAAMKRLGALQQKDNISKLFVGVAASVDNNDASELTMNELGLTLLKSGGAHKPTYYDFGNGEKVQLADLTTDQN